MATVKKRKRSSAALSEPIDQSEHTATPSSPSKKRKLSADDAASITGPEDITDADEVTDPNTIAVSKYKEDINAFSVAVKEDADFISPMPSEVLDQILSYLLLDHDPERAVKKHAVESFKPGENWKPYEDIPHVLLSMAAMSTCFRAHVETFSQRHLTTHAEFYRFTTTEQLEAKRNKPRRHSDRLKSKGVVAPDPRCYRKELVKTMQAYCMGCRCRVIRRHTMYNGVSSCHDCEQSVKTFNLTHAKKWYGLQDWMLIPSRNPRLRAKHPHLPIITYGTVRIGTPYLNGMTTSYRFWPKDVRMLAQAVHGNVEEHMKARRLTQRQRKKKRQQKEHIAMRIRRHTDLLAVSHDPESSKFHQDRLNFYTDPACPEKYRRSKNNIRSYGPYPDVHKRLCIDEFCRSCEWRNNMKYMPDYWAEAFDDYEDWWDDDADNGYYSAGGGDTDPEDIDSDEDDSSHEIEW